MLGTDACCPQFFELSCCRTGGKVATTISLSSFEKSFRDRVGKGTSSFGTALWAWANCTAARLTNRAIGWLQRRMIGLRFSLRQRNRRDVTSSSSLSVIAKNTSSEIGPASWPNNVVCPAYWLVHRP